MSEYLISVSNIRGGKFGSWPGKTRFLRLPSDRALPSPSHGISRREWVSAVMAGARSWFAVI